MPKRSPSGRCGYCHRKDGSHSARCPKAAGHGEPRIPGPKPPTRKAPRASKPAARNGWEAKLVLAKARVAELRAELAREEIRVQLITEYVEGP